MAEREGGGVFSHLSVVFIECTRLFDDGFTWKEKMLIDGNTSLYPKNGLRFQIFFCVGFHYMYFYNACSITLE